MGTRGQSRGDGLRRDIVLVRIGGGQDQCRAILILGEGVGGFAVHGRVEPCAKVGPPDSQAYIGSPKREPDHVTGLPDIGPEFGREFP